jgi:hypothetical protein
LKALRSPPWLGWPLWNICVTNDHWYVPLVVNTSRPFPHSCVSTGFVTRLAQRVSQVEQELLTLSKNMSSPPVHSGVRVTRSLILFLCLVDRCLSFCPFSFGHCVVCPSIYGFWLHLWYLQTLLTPERIYIEIPVLSAHLYLPFRVPSAMCPQFLVAKLTYPMPINCWLWEICVHVLKWISNRSCRRHLGRERSNLFLKWHSLQ